MNISELKPLVGTRLYWDDISSRYIIIRSGILDKPHNGQICFDGSHDYMPPSHYKNLRTTYENK